MPRPISNKPGDAKIDRQGHTANSKFGTDPNVLWRVSARSPRPEAVTSTIIASVIPSLIPRLGMTTTRRGDSMKYEVVIQNQNDGDQFVTTVLDSDEDEIPEKGTIVQKSRTVVDPWQVIRVSQLDTPEEETAAEADAAEISYDDMTHDELRAEIDSRNADREPEDHIAVSGTNAELANRLTVDDEENS